MCGYPAAVTATNARAASPLAGAHAALRGLPGRAAGRLRDGWYRIVLAGATAAGAWVLAQLLLGQPAPIFAPIAAVVCLTDNADRRGRRALRLLCGVCAGVVVGEAATRVIGAGWLQVAVAVLAGMLVVSVGSINPLTLLQAGIASLLVVGLASPQTGWTRLASAVVGGALALLVSQVLATPSPVRYLADAARRALGPPADALEEAAAALRERSLDRARAAAEGLRAGHDVLATFLDTRSGADTIAGSTLRGRRERSRVRELQRRFGGVEYVYAGSVLLTRTAVEVVEDGATVPERLVGGVEDLAASLRAVAADPVAGDPRSGSGRCDGDRAHEVAERLAATDPADHDAHATQLATQLHLLAADVATLTDPVSAVRHPADTGHGGSSA